MVDPADQIAAVLVMAGLFGFLNDRFLHLSDSIGRFRDRRDRFSTPRRYIPERVRPAVPCRFRVCSGLPSQEGFIA